MKSFVTLTMKPISCGTASTNFSRIIGTTNDKIVPTIVRPSPTGPLNDSNWT